MKCGVLSLAAGIALATSPGAAADRDARKNFRNFTACEAEWHHKEAIQLVLSDTTSEDIENSEFMSPNYCLSAGGLMPPAAAFRIPAGEFILFGLAEALLRRDYWNGLPADIKQAVPLTHRPIAEAEYKPRPEKKANAKELADLQQREKLAQAMRALSIYAECVARTDPGTAFRLVTSEPDTSYEISAFTKLQPALASCLDKGRSIVLDKTAVRGAIALNLYRLAKAPRVQPGTLAK